jgi:hypothetical protein
MHATVIVMQQLYASLERLQEQNEVSKLFCDIITCAIPEARWQYLLLLYALIIPNAPAGLFALSDVAKLIHKLYPLATDGETHEIMQRYRESGLVCSVKQHTQCRMSSFPQSTLPLSCRQHLPLGFSHF